MAQSQGSAIGARCLTYAAPIALISPGPVEFVIKLIGVSYLMALLSNGPVAVAPKYLTGRTDLIML